MGVGGLLAWAFAAGVLAAVNPCGFAILPGYIAHYIGVPRAGGSPLHGLLVGASVTAGKLTVFGVIAAVFVAGGRAVVRVAPWAGAGVGVALIAVGIWVLAGHTIKIPVPGGRAPESAGYRSAYVFGLGYGACSLACCLPIFLGVFLGIGGGLVGSVGGSVALFLAYAAGVAAVLVPLFVVTGRVRSSLVVRLRRLSRYTAPVSGVLLALSGVVLAATWIPALTGDRTLGPLGRLVLGWQRWAQALVVRAGFGFWAAAGLAVAVLVALSVLRARPPRGGGVEAPAVTSPTTTG